VLRLRVLRVSRPPTGGPGLRVRPAAPADLPAVLELLRGALLPVEGVAEAFDGFVIGEDAGRVVAAAGVERHGMAALLRSVVVDPEWRGRSAGAALLAYLFERTEAEGLAATYLLTTTAEGWFPRFGFRVVPREDVPGEIRATREFAAVCPATAVLMVRGAGGAAGPEPDASR
jgi:amino-acid N-acetyltransferase